jgi:hypothetical protein
MDHRDLAGVYHGLATARLNPRFERSTIGSPHPAQAGGALAPSGARFMPTFDVVSEVDMQEVTNAVDQANREVRTRFDFKGTDSRYSREGAAITLKSESDFQLRQMLDMLQGKLNKRGIDIACLGIAEPELVGKEARQTVTIRQGLETDLSRKVVKMLKESKFKVQGAIQGDKVRVTGKKRDDLQQVIGSLREATFDMPLQYINFRD